MTIEPSPLLDVRDVTVEFSQGFGRPRTRAVDQVSLQVESGETVGLVGESGSGKTTLGFAILGLVPVVSGSVHFDRLELTAIGRSRRRVLGQELQVVFQNPYSSLNPARTIGRSVAEPLATHTDLTRREIRQRVAAMLEMVGLPKDSAERYPVEFSGGQRQRVAIARALVGSPKFVICDEVTSSLDLSVQAQIINLLKDLQTQLHVAYLFIGHNLAVVRHVSSRIAAMYRGEIVEYGPAARVYETPTHPYTRVLVASAPQPDPTLPNRWPERSSTLSALSGPGCPYSDRCAYVMPQCREERPILRAVLSGQVLVACHLYGDATKVRTPEDVDRLLADRRVRSPNE